MIVSVVGQLKRALYHLCKLWGNMNQEKLTESLLIFNDYFNTDVYYSEEREFKNYLRDVFKRIFSTKAFSNETFIDDLLDELNNPKTRGKMIHLIGGKHYEYNNLCEILSIEKDKTLTRKFFYDLLYSSNSIKSRINEFKRAIEALYQKYDYKGLAKIQLNLISQFLGFFNPSEFYIYKYDEFNRAVNYFEYKGRYSDKTAGDKYVYYLGFVQELYKAFQFEKELNIDFLDIQTFVYRTDWYEPSYEEVTKEKFEIKTNELAQKNFNELYSKINYNIKRPSYIVKSRQRYRDPNISAIVKKDANGYCDLCNKYAPFENKKNLPYLESHHIVFLSEGGDDVVNNCVALCPNCHKKMHVLNLEKDKIHLIKIAKERYIRTKPHVV